MDELVGSSLARILPCSSIYLSPPNPLTLYLKISRKCLFCLSLPVLHILTSTAPPAGRKMSISGLGSIRPRRSPHFPLTVKCSTYFQGPCFKFPVNWELLQWREIIYCHSTHRTAESTESQDKRVRTLHIFTKLLSSLPAYNSTNIISS